MFDGKTLLITGVLMDTSIAFHEASATGKHIDLTSTCERPAPLPIGLTPGTVELDS